MSNDEADAVAEADPRPSGGSPRRAVRAIVMSGALLLGLGGLAACGDDDDASDTVTGQTDESASSSDVESAPSTTRAVATSSGPSTTGRAVATSSGPSTTGRASTTTAPAATSTSAAAEGTAPTGTEAAEGSAEAQRTAASTTQPAPSETSSTAATEITAAATDSSAPTGSGPEGTAPESSSPESSGPDDTGPPASIGPTTTGPECEYTANDEFPLERCDAGPAILALQSVLQSREYGIGTVDCLFGDQTFYTVRAFQTDEELPVDGIVGPETWEALEVLDQWGDDANGNGSIEPNEITLECS